MRRQITALLNRFRTFASYRFNWATERRAYEALRHISIGTASPPLAKRLLLDGHFLNPGYYYRLQLFRAAVASGGGNELGFVWRHNTAQCTQVLRTLGIRNVCTYFPNPDPKLRNEARRMATRLRFADDLLALEFPGKVPAAFLYDDILKRQRAATVVMRDPLLELYVWEFLSSIKAAERLIESHDPDLIAMSHAITTQCAPLAWLGAQNRIPVVTLFGNYGVPRFWRMSKPEHIYNSMDSPRKSELDSLSLARAEGLASIGRSYLNLRLSGKTNDLGASMAFSGTGGDWCFARANDTRPVVAVYASNWFDFPHALGMSRFRDFADWITSTIRIASQTRSVRWLLRGHPCDKHYGGISLATMLPKGLPEHVSVLPDSCPGKVVMEVADAAVTYHGTVAIEFAAQGKPVLIPDRGWYHDCGFVLFPESREHYLQLLQTEWFNTFNTGISRRRAEIYAGWYFCIPDWQAAATLPDDSDRARLRQSLTTFTKSHGEVVRREVDTIRDWMLSGHRAYHTYKMANSENFALSNLSQ